MTQTFDAYQMVIAGVMDTTETTNHPPTPVYAYHIHRRPGDQHWRARYHQMLFADPIPADEAVQRVATGLSCYVERDGLQMAIEHLAQIGIVVEVEAPGMSKRSV